jgi:hypothetical protein
MKKLFILFFITYIFGFEVEYTKIYSQYVIPQKDAVFIQTKKQGLSFPFKYIKTKNGYILPGDTDKINMWLDNRFYAPDDAKFKNIKIAKINPDKIQYKIIRQTKQFYKNCQIKKIIFLSPDESKIIYKPKNIKIKYKILLECK